MSTIIKCENISYTYEDMDDEPNFPAIRDISLDIEEGSFTAILGHNGSGKSTLAKILCTVLSPDSGRLWICGNELTADDVTDDTIYKARRDVGMVFQNPDNQIVATIVEEDVAFGPENLGFEPAEIRRRVDEALATVHMSEYARHECYKLSGGQKQRVAIAGAIAMKRRCIIFDESTAMLDPMGRDAVMETIEYLNRVEGITVILITHYMNEAVHADRVIVMNDGGILMDDTPARVFQNVETLWNAGLDVPQTTELLYKMKKRGFDVRIDIFDAEGCAAEVARVIGAGSTGSTRLS